VKYILVIIGIPRSKLYGTRCRLSRVAMTAEDLASSYDTGEWRRQVWCKAGIVAWCHLSLPLAVTSIMTVCTCTTQQ